LIHTVVVTKYLPQLLESELQRPTLSVHVSSCGLPAGTTNSTNTHLQQAIVSVGVGAIRSLVRSLVVPCRSPFGFPQIPHPTTTTPPEKGKRSRKTGGSGSNGGAANAAAWGVWGGGVWWVRVGCGCITDRDETWRGEWGLDGQLAAWARCKGLDRSFWAPAREGCCIVLALRNGRVASSLACVTGMNERSERVSGVR